MKLPDFICIGAQKSGTTWLYRELGRHPGVRMPKLKELRFFGTNFLKPIRGGRLQYYTYYLTPWNWLPRARFRLYCRHFAGCEGYLTGDVSPGYIASPAAPRRIHAQLPQAKLLALVRNPVDRAYSQWRMIRHNGIIAPTMSFLEAFRSDVRRLRSQGHYADDLTRYAAFYPLGRQLRIYLYDDLCRDASTFLQAIYEYLELPPFDSPTVQERQETHYRSDGLKMTTEERREAVEYYRAHNQRLAELLQRPLNWN